MMTRESPTMTQIREALVTGAEQEWRRPVKDYHPGQEATPDLIHRYWKAAGWLWYLDDYSNGTYTEQWQDSPVQAWCGIFLSFLGQRLGDYIYEDRCVDVSVKRDLVTKVFPSTDRLYNHRSDFHQPGLSQLERGDIITTGDGRDGSHIRLVRTLDDAKENALTVEGNGHGTFPDGSTGEGVVHDEVAIDEIKQTYRLGRKHVVGQDAPLTL